MRCNISLYVYPDGHSNFYFMKDDGSWVTHRKDLVTMPSNNTLETVGIFIDILDKMHKKAKKIKLRR
ncbi:MAG: hypothetical protein V1840_01655 [Candidatus Omnitrophota bacterium]